ncbi:putative 39S ribosomal protein L23, mitochondrial, partial [Cyphomyrmex costatus]
YPIYQRGNPQLRVFLPNFWMKLITPIDQQPLNVVQFHCSMEMTKYDIKNYLEKIYNVNVINVRTRIQMGRLTRDRLQHSVIKEDDKKIAYVVLFLVSFYKKEFRILKLFISCRYIKKKVTSQPFTTKEDLNRRIRTTCTKMTPEILFRVRQSFVKRTNKCLDANDQ